MKRIAWRQLGDIHDKKILDFGSGIGMTANYLAENNDVTAIELDIGKIKWWRLGCVCLIWMDIRILHFFHHLMIEKI